MDHCLISDYDEEEDYSFKEPSRVDVDDYRNLKPRNSSYKIITGESLLASQMDHLHRVMDLLSVRQHHARTLLIQYRWDTERLLQVYVEKGRDILFAQAGVSIVEHQQHVSSLPAPLNVIRCEICTEDVSIDEVLTMECGHCYCNTCWTGHFIVKINEGQSRYVRCMTFQCEAICDEAIVSRLVRISDTKLADKFEKCLIESYIEDNKKVKWCPSVPHCGSAIRVDDAEVCEVECSCGLLFCFKCLEGEHSPCSCLIWELWNQKCRDESETVNWIAVHAKNCPGCNKPVHKDGGCNVVTCICKQRFCWKCGKATKAYHDSSSHQCGVYNTDTKAKTIELAKQELDRYMHYYNHYKAHTDSFKLETQLKEKIQHRVSLLEAKRRKLKDFSWVTSGIGSLFRSRHVLSNSYPLAYIIFGNHPFEDELTCEERETKQHLFEYHQQQLEHKVERLSMYLGKPFDNLSEDEVTDTRTQILNLSRITEYLCKQMYEYIEDDLLAPLQVGQHSIAPYNSSFDQGKSQDFHSGWARYKGVRKKSSGEGQNTKKLKGYMIFF